MRIDRAETIGGQPILKVRDFLRRVNRHGLSKHTVADFFKVSERKALAIVREMKSRQWIEPGPPFGIRTQRGWYRVTRGGRRLANANAVPPISRAKADQILKAFLDRVADVNARDELTHYVEEVGVFGSYLNTKAKDLGDIDICLALGEREIPGRDFIKYSGERASKSGRRFSNIAQYWDWGETEVRLLQKAPNRYLAFHNPKDLDRIGAHAKLIFEAK